MPRGAFGFSATEVELAGSSLVRLVKRHLPKEVRANESELALENWTVVGPAMMAKSAGTLDSMLALMPHERTSDCTVLLRSLYDGALALGWIAGSPRTRLPSWIKRTSQEAMRAAADWEAVGLDHLADRERVYCEGIIKDRAVKAPPPRTSMADDVDSHWSQFFPRMAPLEGEQATVLTFRGLYRHLYRSGSSHAHYDLRSLGFFFTANQFGRVFVHEERQNEYALYPWLHGVYVLALALLIGAHAFGWPPSDEVVAAMQQAHLWNPD